MNAQEWGGQLRLRVADPANSTNSTVELQQPCRLTATIVPATLSTFGFRSCLVAPYSDLT